MTRPLPQNKAIRRLRRWRPVVGLRKIFAGVLGWNAPCQVRVNGGAPCVRLPVHDNLAEWGRLLLLEFDFI